MAAQLARASAKLSLRAPGVSRSRIIHNAARQDIFRRSSLPPRIWSQSVLCTSRTWRNTICRFRQFSSSDAKDQYSANEVELTRMQRLKKLFRTHGWSALAIYLILSFLDFSLVFLLIYAVGTDKVRDAEDWVLDALGWRRKDGEPGKIKKAVTHRVEEWKENHPRAHRNEIALETSDSKSLKSPSTASRPQQEEPELKVGQSAYSAIATTAVLAYAIHKTALLPFRVGLTLAITPRVVRILQGWGWKVGMAGGTSAAVATTAGSAAET